MKTMAAGGFGAAAWLAFEQPVTMAAAYADDISILITGVCPSTLSSIMERTLREIREWAEEVGLSINADKTDLILFTKRYKVPIWTPPKIDQTMLTPKSQVKYLGTVLDRKLAWRPNVVERVKKATLCIQEDAQQYMGPVTCSNALDLHLGGATNSAVWSLSVVAGY
ncbi:GL22382 [Drosophila persimilis]|uniref:GL22382 n=1 Tax=Drosophila persimilis TaxID=7234 RepID=B4HCN2_DROPE|nr:GL22382 [Drosophila persimilis]